MNYPYFEHLEEFIVSINFVNQSEVAIIQKQIQRFFENNPQIRRVSYEPAKRDVFIRVISENLPNLEELTIWNMDALVEPVQFDCVKRLSLK